MVVGGLVRLGSLINDDYNMAGTDWVHSPKLTSVCVGEIGFIGQRSLQSVWVRLGSCGMLCAGSKRRSLYRTLAPSGRLLVHWKDAVVAKRLCGMQS